MSMHDDGHGRRAGPAADLQSGFVNNQGVGTASGGESWSGSALDTRKSEVFSMAQGPGRPLMGQPQPMFGGGASVFAPMPTYTPVTRGNEPPPRAPEPAPSYHLYPANQPPAPPMQPAGPNYQNPPQHHQPQGGYALPNYEPAYRSPNFSNPAPSPSFPPSNYDGGTPGYQGLSGYQPPSFPDASFLEPSFDPRFPQTNPPDLGRKDASFAEQNFNTPSFPAPNFPNQSFGDASFPEPNFDAGNFSGASAFSNLDAGLGHAGNAFAPQQPQDASFETYGDEGAQDFAMAPQGSSAPQSHVPPSDPRRQLQAFDAIYDQPPQIGLGSAAPRIQAPNFYEGERADADFLDDDQVAPPSGANGKPSSLKGRSVFMVGSALLGAIALGGALAFAYKQSGGGMGSGEPPLVQADNRPVKELPEQAGGKEFPHKNKLIYDRLTNGDQPESEQLVPRQEEVAVPALPPSTEAPNMPMPVATTDMVNPQTQAVAAAGGAEDTDADGGPRRVKTLRVLPDGSVEMPEEPAQVSDAATQAVETTASTPPLPEAPAAPQDMAAMQPAPMAAPAAPQQMAALPPAAAAPAPAAPSKYVVQLGAKKNQTEALATFADIQQKHPTLLANYRPMVQKADLGSKGTWYRLRVGPIDNKTTADKLCSQLKSQGLPDCLVMGQ